MGYSTNTKSYRVYNPVTQRIMESRSVMFIETPSQLLLPSWDVAHTQGLPSCDGIDVHNYTTDDDVMWDPCDYTSVFGPFRSASENHVAAGGSSANPPVAERLGWICDITWRDMLDRRAAAFPHEGRFFGGASLEGFLKGDIMQGKASPK